MTNIQLVRDKKLDISDIVIGLKAFDKKYYLRPNYKTFFTNLKPRFSLSIHYGILPKIKLDKKIFYSNLFNIYSLNGSFIYTFSFGGGSLPYMVAIFDRDFRNADLFYKRLNRSIIKLVYTLNYPFDEMLLVNLLSQRYGLLVHACGVKIKNKGYLFMGPSGAGKSAIAKIINNDKRFTILSDDRIGLRRLKDKFYIYGTPWSGTAGFVSNQKAKLEKIFFLRHSQINRITKLSKQESVLQSSRCLFFPFWDRSLLNYSLETMNELIQEIPCFNLDFVPDRSILELIKSSL